MTIVRLLASILVFASMAACSPAVTLADARAVVATAQASLQQAIALQQQGQAQPALEEARRANDTFAEARDAFLSARADQCDDADVLVEFATLCERLGDTDLAGEAYLRAAEIRPEDATLWYRAGRNFVDAGGRYLARAAQPLDRAEQIVRTMPGAVFPADIEAARGDVSWKNGAYDIAKSRYAAAEQFDPQHTRMLLGLMMVNIATGAFAAAETNQVTVMTNDKSVDMAAIDRRIREAYLVYLRTRPAVAEDPADYRALASFAIRIGFVNDASRAAEHVLTLDPNNVFALNMLGSLAHRDGNIERARRMFTRSLEIQPDQPRTRDALAGLGNPTAGQGPLR